MNDILEKIAELGTHLAVLDLYDALDNLPRSRTVSWLTRIYPVVNATERERMKRDLRGYMTAYTVMTDDTGNDDISEITNDTDSTEDRQTEETITKTEETKQTDDNKKEHYLMILTEIQDGLAKADEPITSRELRQKQRKLRVDATNEEVKFVLAKLVEAGKIQASLINGTERYNLIPAITRD